jgi:ABC-2 type transport system ATP-binding protein
VISTEGLTREFEGTVAVEDVTFSVAEGQLLALLGPNGAGKTTTVRMLLGLIAPTRGRATVAGHDVSPAPGERSALRAACGLLTETPGFYDRLSGWDNLQFFARLYRIPEHGLAARLEQLLRRMELWDARSRLVATYSKGMKQRLALIRALFHDPRILFLDEPTSGLDPEAAASVRELILSLKGEGRTIVVCTHNLDEATRLADVVGIIRRRLIRFERLDAIRNAAGGEQRLHIRLRRPGAMTVGAQDLGVATLERPDPTTLVILADDLAARTPAIVRRLVEAGAEIVEVRPEERSLEAMYLETVRGQA